jgi:hypothetical protein
MFGSASDGHAHWLKPVQKAIREAWETLFVANGGAAYRRYRHARGHSK